MRYTIRSHTSLVAILIALGCCWGLAQQAPGSLAAHATALLAAGALQDAAADDAEISEDAYFESAADHDGIQPRQYLIEPRYPDIVPRSFQPRFPPTRSLHYGYPRVLEALENDLEP